MQFIQQVQGITVHRWAKLVQQCGTGGEAHEEPRLAGRRSEAVGVHHGRVICGRKPINAGRPAAFARSAIPLVT